MDVITTALGTILRRWACISSLLLADKPHRQQKKCCAGLGRLSWEGGRFWLKFKIIWVFPKIGVPQNGWFIMKNPIKIHDLGSTPIFGNTHLLPRKLTAGTSKLMVRVDVFPFPLRGILRFFFVRFRKFTAEHVQTFNLPHSFGTGKRSLVPCCFLIKQHL